MFKGVGEDAVELWVENKVSAEFQPDQMKRHVERARRLETSERRICVALFAPEAYRDRSQGAAFLAYEAVKGWMEEIDDDRRTPYKRRLVEAALDRSKAVVLPDDAVTAFWLGYQRIAETSAPALRMPKVESKPTGAAFVRFACKLPGDLKILHKLAKDAVDLEFRGLGSQTNELQSALAGFLDSAWTVEKTNKSASVRVAVPHIQTGRPLSVQSDAVRASIAAAQTLHDWAMHHGPALKEIIRHLQTTRGAG